MLGANDNRLDFRQIIDSGTVLIVNLGGFHDEETQRLLGSLLVTSLGASRLFAQQSSAGRAQTVFLHD